MQRSRGDCITAAKKDVLRTMTARAMTFVAEEKRKRKPTREEVRSRPRHELIIGVSTVFFAPLSFLSWFVRAIAFSMDDPQE